MRNVAAMSILFWVCIGLVAAQGAKAKGSGSLPFDDPGRPIEVTAGSEFVIALDSNPTTGYQWQLAEPVDERIVTLVKNEYEIPQKPGMTGTGGKHVWTFKAVGQGQAVISLKYLRPWEKDIPPLKQARFTVIVKK